MTDPGGELRIRIHRRHSAVQIDSSRPLTATRVFAGKPATEVAAQLPLLYSVCQTAQALACVQACEGLLGIRPAPAAAAQRTLLALAETAKEHLWRLLLDWPRALAPLGDTPPAQPPQLGIALRAYLALRRACADHDPLRPGAVAAQTDATAAAAPIATLVDLAEQWVFATPPRVWLDQVGDADALLRWASGAVSAPAALVRAIQRDGMADLGRNRVPTLAPEPNEAELNRIEQALAGGDADHFVARPCLDGTPMETTPLAREIAIRGVVAELAQRYGNGLLPRLAAVLLELARTLAALEQAAASCSAGASTAAGIPARSSARTGAAIGIAQAARGLLVHRIAGAADRVTRYHILAPTEWNFHPRGVVAEGLAAIARDLDGRADDALLQRWAALYITAVDPCVAYRLEITDGD